MTSPAALSLSFFPGVQHPPQPAQLPRAHEVPASSLRREELSPRAYRPLVKHFASDDDNCGFDLARVKMEPGVVNPSELASFKSYIQRRRQDESSPTPPSSPAERPSAANATEGADPPLDKPKEPSPKGGLTDPAFPITDLERVTEGEIAENEAGTARETEEDGEDKGDGDKNKESMDTTGGVDTETDGSEKTGDNGHGGGAEDVSSRGQVSQPESSLNSEVDRKDNPSTTEAKSGEENSESKQNAEIDQNQLDEEDGASAIEQLSQEEIEEMEEDGEVLHEEEEMEEDEMDIKDEPVEEDAAALEEQEASEVEELSDFDEDGAPKDIRDDDDGSKDKNEPSSTAAATEDSASSSSQSYSPFKKPSTDSDFQASSASAADPTSSSAPGSSATRKRHRSFGSTYSGCSDSSKSINVDQQREVYQQQLAYYRKPMVGKETVCIFCLQKCSDKVPKLLNCLHSACADCFKENIETARAEAKPVASVIVDEDDAEVAPVEFEASIQCPLCRVSTTEKEAVDNLFLLTDTDEGYDGQESQICVSICIFDFWMSKLYIHMF